jgi:predicted transcriptional regulator
MRTRGYSQRDIGILLGISHQAVGKLLSEKAPPLARGKVLGKKTVPSAGKRRINA